MGNSNKTKIIVYALIFLLLALFIAGATVTLLFICLLPSFVAWFIDRTEQKYAAFCVTGLNFCGLFPYLIELWGDHNMEHAINLITDVFVMVVVYGSAAMGWAMFLFIPPVVSSFMTALTERRLSALRANQAKLINEWGEEVTHAVRPPGEAAPMSASAGPPPDDIPMDDEAPGADTPDPVPPRGAQEVA